MEVAYTEVIVGAGLAGLTAGIDLARMGGDVTVLEMADFVGVTPLLLGRQMVMFMISVFT